MEKATLVFINGNIQTCDIDQKLSCYSAMAVKGERILAVGCHTQIEPYIGQETKVVDLKGKTVLPGMCDAHIHASDTLEITGKYNFYDTCEKDRTREEVIGMVQNTIVEYKRNEDISSGIRITGWNPLVFLDSKEGMPTAKDLDAVCDEVPVVLRSVCQHYLWLNSKAMEKAGVTKATQTPKNGVIYRDEEGNPTGIFQELPAVNMIKEILPEADHTVEEYKESILTFQSEYALPMGITMVCDAMATPNAVEAYKQLAKEKKLSIRVSGVYAADSDKSKDQFDTFIAHKDQDTIGDLYHIPTVKFFVDGVEFMFYMNEPFEAKANENAGYPKEYCGFPQWSLDDTKEIFAKLDRAGFQIHVHAMGDGAVRETLEAIEYARKQNPFADNRHAIAHVMNITAEDRKKMAYLKVIASIQHCWCAMDSTEEGNIFMMGKKRIEEAYPFGLLEKDGVRLAAGTDFPIVPFLNPFLGMQVGMTRILPKSHPEHDKYKNWKRGGEESCVSYAAMLASYTINGAYEMFYDDICGELAEGKSADFVILDCNLDTLDVMEYENIKPQAVYFKGKLVYEAKSKDA